MNDRLNLWELLPENKQYVGIDDLMIETVDDVGNYDKKIYIIYTKTMFGISGREIRNGKCSLVMKEEIKRSLLQLSNALQEIANDLDTTRKE